MAPIAATSGRPHDHAATDRSHEPARAPWAVLLAAAVALVFVTALTAPGVLDTTDPLALHLSQALPAPGPWHWFGTDEAGRDLRSQVGHGCRPSLAIGFGASVVSPALAVLQGALAALGGKVLAPAVDRVAEVLFSVPSLLLALLLVALLGLRPRPRPSRSASAQERGTARSLR